MSDLENIFKNIADAIRSVDGTTDLMSTDEMPDRIKQLSGDSDIANKIINPIPPYCHSYSMEAVYAAESYYLGSKGLTFRYGSPYENTSNDPYQPYLDNVSWMILVLSGYPFQYTQYYNNAHGGAVYTASPYEWADKYLSKQSNLPNKEVRTINELESYMQMCGRVFTDFSSLRWGDIVFFSSNPETGLPGNYVGIVNALSSTGAHVLCIVDYNNNPYIYYTVVTIYENTNNVKFYARPIYDQNFKYEYPGYSSSFNLLSYPWKESPETVMSKYPKITNIEYDGQNNTIIIENSHEINKDDNIIIDLVHANRHTLTLDSGTYELSGAPAASSGMRGSIRIINNETIIASTSPNTTEPVIFTLDRGASCEADIYIHSSNADLSCIWTPKLVRIK